MTEETDLTRAHARGASAPALLEQTIGENLDATIARFGDREALVSCQQGLRYTYAELGVAVDELARGLIAAGLQQGDRVGVWSPNRAEWTLTQYATAKLGLILVNVNPAYRTSELEYALRQSGCRVLFAAPAFKTSDYRAMVAEVAPKLDALETVIFFESPEWEALLASATSVDDAELARRAAALTPEDPINIQYTSGTTGFPKGATLSPPQHPEQRLPGRRGLLATPSTDRDLRAGALLSLLRHGHGQSGRVPPTARCIVIPSAGLRPGCHACRRSPRTSNALRSTACRRCSSPSWTHAHLRRAMTSARCGPGSWPARRARSR